MKITHLGSSIAISLGALLFLIGVQAHTDADIDIAGAAVIVGALAYRSAKKRKLGEVPNTYVRIRMELLGLVAIFLSVALKNDRNFLMATHPITNIVIPFLSLVPYPFIALKKAKVPVRAAVPPPPDVSDVS